MRRLHGAFAAAADRGPADFSELLLVPGVGARTVRALAMVAEVMHGAPCRFSDPARFSLAHGGKDGHPFPVPLTVYDETIRVVKSALSQRQARARRAARRAASGSTTRRGVLERHASGPSLEAVIAEERAHAHRYGGRTVFGWATAAGGGASALIVSGWAGGATVDRPRRSGVHASVVEGASLDACRHVASRFGVPPRSRVEPLLDFAHAASGLGWLARRLRRDSDRDGRPSGCATKGRREKNMSTFRTSVLGLAAGAAALAFAGPALALDEITFGTNWVAEAEHGGFYQAVADGTYEKYGLKVTIIAEGRAGHAARRKDPVLHAGQPARHVLRRRAGRAR